MKLKSSQRKSIAAIPTAFKGQERRYAQSVSENLDTLSGRRGNIIDRAVTFRDLLDSGVLKLAGGILSDGGIDVTNPNDPNSDENGPIELPTKPDNLTVTGGFESMFLGWSLPPYNGHDYIEIFRFASDNIVSAESAGAYTRYYGDQYFYVDENVGNQETWYYWVRAVNKNGVTGPFNSSTGTVGTSALDYLYVSDLIDDIIADDINNLGLNTKIDLIDANIVEVENSIAALDAEVANDIAGINSDIDALNSINAWSSTTAYAVADLVTYSNKIWEATLASTNQAPSASSTYWTLVGNYTNLVDFVSATQSQNSSTRATLTSDYYTITDANSAISTATTGLASTTSVNTALGNYTTTANLNQNFYTKTATDSAITSATTGLASTTSVNTALGNYTTTSNLNQNFYTKTATDSAISSATTGLASTTSVNTALGNYTTTSNLNQNFYTKTATDSAITSATTGLASTTSVNTALGNYTTTSSLNQNFYTKTGADSAISSATNGLASTTYVNNQLGNYVTSANLSQNYYTKTAADSAISTGISNFTTTVNGQTSTLQQVHESTNGNASKYAIKIDNNNHISGYGLISTANNGTPTAAFVVAVDRFAIAAPTTATSAESNAVGNAEIPFKVLTTTTTINGEQIPAGAYINDAFIHDAQITNAVIADATITSAKIFDLSATRISSGQISMDNSNNIAIFQGKRTFVGYSQELQKNIYTVNFASTAAGFALGNNNGNPYFHIGNATNYLKFDGSNMYVTGASINDLSVTTLQIGPTAVTVPDGENASGLSINVGGSFINVDSGYNYLSDWDVNSVPSSFLITGNVQFVGTNTVNQTSRPATAGIRFAWDWKTNQGAWSPAGTSQYNKTIGQQSLAQTFGGQAVSTTKIDVPSWSRGMRIRIQARNDSNYGGSGSTSRKLTGYGYFIVAAKR